MKAKPIIASILAALLFSACTKNDNVKEASDTGTPIDTAVVGKDTSPVSTRKDIENSDEQKLTLPGRDTTNTDERQ
ncbi:hypothetical protein [Dyadobacter fermentans]|uniref:Uncharacterized protein n=1 Tax=Dyadobacter fermentans (strain ATCC 700827 / DSM 18053 / CIP 107007 / KCTC 52180 / NS114) TaxID=471854 RepID=C6VZG4_DYAFD|nr:hypothetical protein [Dyadobacter fermentans]ACT91776.1 hypothetical protein Dfer_0509 [Dyadobacter fermentans DSM 18053]